MNKIKLIIAVIAVSVPMFATAQYSQLRSKTEFMMKIEAGYMPFMGNAGDPGEYGYYIRNFQNAANANVMAGVNISQDWFLGGGVGYCYYYNTKQELAESLSGVNFFIDMDFRPVWTSIIPSDYQPTSIKFAPVFGIRGGGSLLMGNADEYGNTITPMGEFYGGINWYYYHGLHNMERNWHSFYATIGIAYMQQAIYLPVRIGWRW